MNTNQSWDEASEELTKELDRLGVESIPPTITPRCPFCVKNTAMEQQWGGWFCKTCNTNHANVVVQSFTKGYNAAMAERTRVEIRILQRPSGAV